MPLDLVILLISENDLRSALTARLTMLGINVVTLGPGQTPDSLPVTTVASGILVTDDDAIGCAAGATQSWLQVIVLHETPGQPDDRPLRVSRQGGTRKVVEALGRWRTPTPQE